MQRAPSVSFFFRFHPNRTARRGPVPLIKSEGHFLHVIARSTAIRKGHLTAPNASATFFRGNQELNSMDGLEVGAEFLLLALKVDAPAGKRKMELKDRRHFPKIPTSVVFGLNADRR